MNDGERTGREQAVQITIALARGSVPLGAHLLSLAPLTPVKGDCGARLP